MDETVTVPEASRAFLEEIAVAGMASAAEGLSSFVGEPITLSAPAVVVVPIYDLPDVFGGPDAEGIGIYLGIEGDLHGHVMLLLSRDNALDLVRLLMSDLGEEPQGLGVVERSALAEVGNLTASLFLNSLAAITGAEVRPTPPAVMEDMVGAILDVVAVTMAQVSEYVLVMETAFQRRDQRVEALFWVIPDYAPLRELMLRRDKGVP